MSRAINGMTGFTSRDVSLDSRRVRQADRPPELDEESRRRVFAAVSLLVGYPDTELLGRLPLLRRSAASTPGVAGTQLNAFLDHLESSSATHLASDYVDTFDLRRRCCLYLTYYAFGDTRKRGAALIRFTTAYREAGLDLPVEELPDHLGVVCHFAALAPAAGTELMSEHRAGIEMLRLALADTRSPYLSVLESLRAALPEPAETDLARALDLARSGPPAEEVGLEPFAPPEYMGGRR